MTTRSKQSQTAAATDMTGKRWMRVREFCEMTSTPIPTAYKYIAEGIVPSVRIGSTIRIPVAAALERLGGAL
jgi:excisionase family DNA binding protein